MDAVTFRFDLHDGETPVATAETTCLFLRPERCSRRWGSTVSPEPMKLYAALARDPTPIHWDAAAAGGRVINQGPLNAGLRGQHADRLGRAGVDPGDRRPLQDNVLAGDDGRGAAAW